MDIPFKLYFSLRITALEIVGDRKTSLSKNTPIKYNIFGIKKNFA